MSTMPPPGGSPSYGAPQPYGSPQPYGAAPQPYGYPVAVAAPTNSLAIVALIGGLLMPIVGIICGHIALNQIKRSGEGGKGLAVTGLVLGYVFTGISLVFLLIYILFFIFAGAVLVGVSDTTSTYGALPALVTGR